MNPENGPVPGAFLGGLTPQTAQVQEILAMLGGLNEGQLQSVQQQMQDRFVTLKCLGMVLVEQRIQRHLLLHNHLMFCLVLGFNDQTM